jgi:hypothetical protein
LPANFGVSCGGKGNRGASYGNYGTDNDSNSHLSMLRSSSLNITMIFGKCARRKLCFDAIPAASDYAKIMETTLMLINVFSDVAASNSLRWGAGGTRAMWPSMCYPKAKGQID